MIITFQLRRLLSCFIFLLVWQKASFAEASFQEAIALVQKEIDENAPSLLFASRNTQILHHGKPSECVVLNLHGLYQSPKDQFGMAQEFFKRGCNVYSPLLKAHWRNDRRAFHNISGEHWRYQVRESLKTARKLGRNVFLVGHSTGGLLALDLSLHFPEQIAGAILLAPAIKLHESVLSYIFWGSIFDVYRYNRSGWDPEYDNYAKPACAGKKVQEIIDGLFQDNKMEQSLAQLKVPTLVIFTENDDTVDHKALQKWSKNKSLQTEFLFYTADQHVFHDNIQRSINDIPKGAPQAWANPYFEVQSYRIFEFLKLENR